MFYKTKRRIFVVFCKNTTNIRFKNIFTTQYDVWMHQTRINHKAASAAIRMRCGAMQIFIAAVLGIASVTAFAFKAAAHSSAQAIPQAISRVPAETPRPAVSATDSTARNVDSVVISVTTVMTSETVSFSEPMLLVDAQNQLHAVWKWRVGFGSWQCGFMHSYRTVDGVWSNPTAITLPAFEPFFYGSCQIEQNQLLLGRDGELRLIVSGRHFGFGRFAEAVWRAGQGWTSNWTMWADSTYSPQWTGGNLADGMVAIVTQDTLYGFRGDGVTLTETNPYTATLISQVQFADSGEVVFAGYGIPSLIWRRNADGTYTSPITVGVGSGTIFGLAAEQGDGIRLLYREPEQYSCIPATCYRTVYTQTLIDDVGVMTNTRMFVINVGDNLNFSDAVRTSGRTSLLLNTGSGGVHSVSFDDDGKMTNFASSQYGHYLKTKDGKGYLLQWGLTDLTWLDISTYRSRSKDTAALGFTNPGRAFGIADYDRLGTMTVLQVGNGAIKSAVVTLAQPDLPPTPAPTDTGPPPPPTAPTPTPPPPPAPTDTATPTATPTSTTTPTPAPTDTATPTATPTSTTTPTPAPTDTATPTPTPTSTTTPTSAPTDTATPTPTPRNTATPAPPPTDNATLTLGGLHSCMLVSSVARCWGTNGGGQLGTYENVDASTPITISGLSTLSAIKAGSYHNCVLIADGRVKCWGVNSAGQLGNGSTTWSRTPVDVSGLSNVTALAIGEMHSCALINDTTVRCWGYNEMGQLGNGFTSDRWTPVTVNNLSDVTMLTTRGQHTCALVSGGTVSCWGWNTEGQLGNGTVQDSASPMPVSNLSQITSIAAGAAHTCALLRNGRVKCWGANWYGQVGDGSTVNRHTPVDVTGLSDVVAISIGSYHSCALTRARQVKCWGFNSSGQLGNGTNQHTITPTEVFGLSHDVTQVEAGGEHTCALIYGWLVKCWGRNDYGQLGNGAQINSVTPVRVAFAEFELVALRNLQVSVGALTPIFVSSTASYTATVENTTTSVILTVTPFHPNGVVQVSNASGVCVENECELMEGANKITVTVTAQNSTQAMQYVVTVTRAGAYQETPAPTPTPTGTTTPTPVSPVTITAVLPSIGAPQANIAVSILGSGFTNVLEISLQTSNGLYAWSFTIVNDQRIDLVMPSSSGSIDVIVRTTANGVITKENAFTYIDPTQIQFDGVTGSEHLMPGGITTTIPPQNVGGSFLLFFEPVSSFLPTSGNLVLHTFSLKSSHNNAPINTLPQPMTMQFPVAASALASGHPTLYRFVSSSGRNTNTPGWTRVEGQSYNPDQQTVSAQISNMTRYVLTTASITHAFVPFVTRD